MTSSRKFKPGLAQFILETEGRRQVELQKSTFSFLNLEASVSHLMTSFVKSSVSISARNRQGTVQTTHSSTIWSQCTCRECTHTAVTDKSPSSMHEQSLLTEHSNITQATVIPDTFTPFNNARLFPHLVNHNASSCSHQPVNQ